MNFDICTVLYLLFDYENTLLHDAAYFNKHKGISSFLFSQGLDVNAEASSGGSSALHGTLYIVRLQEKKGCRVHK